MQITEKELKEFTDSAHEIGASNIGKIMQTTILILTACMIFTSGLGITFESSILSWVSLSVFLVVLLPLNIYGFWLSFHSHPREIKKHAAQLHTAFPYLNLTDIRNLTPDSHLIPDDEELLPAETV